MAGGSALSTIKKHRRRLLLPCIGVPLFYRHGSDGCYRAFMIRPLAAVLLAAACLVGCATSPLTLSVAPTSPPVATPTPGNTVATPSPIPTPTLLALGEAYLVLATEANRWRERLDVAVVIGVYQRTLESWHRVCRVLVDTDQRFIDGVAAIPFTTPFKTLARDLIAKRRVVAALDTKCLKAKTRASAEKFFLQIVTADGPAGRASEKLRLALGLATQGFPY